VQTGNGGSIYTSQEHLKLGYPMPGLCILLLRQIVVGRLVILSKTFFSNLVCNQQGRIMNNGTEKQARLGMLLKALKGGFKKGLPFAATAGAAGGIGHQVGYGSGHETGYGKGSAEGGTNAMRNLYKGLYDLMQQGANSKTDLSPLLELPETRLLKAAADKYARIKLARHVLNLHAINQELNAYSLAGLTKAASVDTSKEMRVKYAALRLQQTIEKRAIGGLVNLGLRGLGMLARGGGRAMQGLGGLAQKGLAGTGNLMQQAGNLATNSAPIAGNVARGLAQKGLAGTGNLMRQAGSSAARGIRANPLIGARITGAVGLGAGLGAPAAASAVNQNVVQPPLDAVRSMYNTAKNIGTRLDNARRALFGPTTPMKSAEAAVPVGPTTPMNRKPLPNPAGTLGTRFMTPSGVGTFQRPQGLPGSAGPQRPQGPSGPHDARRALFGPTTPMNRKPLPNPAGTLGTRFMTPSGVGTFQRPQGLPGSAGPQPLQNPTGTLGTRFMTPNLDTLIPNLRTFMSNRF